MPPTGKKVSIGGVTLVRMQGGQIGQGRNKGVVSGTDMAVTDEITIVISRPLGDWTFLSLAPAPIKIPGHGGVFIPLDQGNLTDEPIYSVKHIVLTTLLIRK